VRHALRRCAVAVFALALAGCGASPGPMGPSDTAPGAASVPLVGPTWRLVSVGGRTVLPGTRVTAVFAEGDRVAGSAGCNSYFGRATVTVSRMAVGGVGRTLMYCGAEG